MSPTTPSSSAKAVDNQDHILEKSTADTLGESENVTSYTPSEEADILRKLDCVILPMMCTVFLFQYLDKQSLSYASVGGLLTDLDMSSSEYSWCSSGFYIGQLVSEYPFIYLMSRLPLTKFVGGTIILWGGICMCLAAPTDYAGFAVVRFLLGFSEGAVSPAFVTMTSYRYKPREHSVRTAIWISMNAIAQIVGSLLMYGIGKNSGLALAPWRIMFIICGALTAAAGLMFLFLMPSGPKDAWFLTSREKRVLELRMAKAHEGGDKTNFSIGQLKEAMLDPKAWLIFWFGVLVTMNSPVLTFASLIIEGLGYDEYQTLLYTSPSGAVQLVLLWVGVIGCTIFPRHRSCVALALMIPPFVGCVLLLKLPTDAGWGVVVASWLASCITAPWSILLSLSASNIKGNTKRSVTNAMFFMGYCAGCIGAPQLWTHSPRYFSGVVTAIVTWILLAIAVCTWWMVCARENARRDTKAGYESGGTETVDDVSNIDVTDGEDKKFRYSY